jgi:general secretion pathway protein J
MKHAHSEHDFESSRRSAERGFESLGRFAEHGFTLVEMMVALLIFGILAAAGVALLASAVRAQGVATKKLDQVGSLNRLDAVMTADLAQAMPRVTRDESGTTLPAFEGGTGQPLLRLVRGGWENPDSDDRPGVQKVEYRLDQGVIERVAYPMLDGAAPLPAAAMFDHVSQVTLRYRLAGAWSDTWQGQPRTPLPDAVEMRITRTDGVVFRELFLVGSGYGTPDMDAGAGNAG